MYRIGIIGSRRYPRLDLIPRLLLGILPPAQIIYTGDAAGVDASVAEWVQMLRLNPEAGHSLIVMPAAWGRLGKAAGSVRNQALVHACDCIIAFWDGVSSGTSQVIALAEAADMPVYVYLPSGALAPQCPSLFGAHCELSLPDMSGSEFLPLDVVLSAR